MIKLPKNEYNIFQIMDRAIAQHELTLDNFEDVMNYAWVKINDKKKKSTK